jgi:hypothetical protein
VIDVQFRKAPRQIICEPPVRCHFASVEEAGARERVDARANRRDPANSLRPSRNPSGNQFARLADARAAPARDDQGVDRGRVTQTGLRLKNNAGFRPERLAGQTDDNHLVARPRFPHLIFRCRDGKCVGWSDHVQRLDSVVSDQSDSQRFHFWPEIKPETRWQKWTSFRQIRTSRFLTLTR